MSDTKSFSLEPVRANRWVFAFNNVPGSSGAEEELAFVCHKVGLPELSFGDITFNRIHEKFHVAGLPSWNSLSSSFYDFIRNASSTAISPGDMLYNWSSMMYNPLTGQMGYKTQYATSATIAMLDPPGNVIRSWNIFSLFPTTVTFGGELDYSSDAIIDVSCTYIYDLAIKSSDSKVVGRSS
jgi:hypothetical protein